MYKYLHVLNDLESMIQNGEIKEGKKLPSIRALVTQYECNKATIIRALHELEKRHIIYSVPQSGYYVVKKSGSYVESNEIIDFASSAPDPDVFPYLDFQHCINKAIDTYKNDLFIYGTPKGLPSLISVVQKQLANYQVFTKEDNIFITSGVQQALAILTSIPFPNGHGTILIEQPSYHLYIEYVETNKIPVIGIKRTHEGIDLNELEKIFRTEKIKFFYTIPRFHHPLGTSYSKKEREKIIKLAKKYNVFIVEDDYLADLETDSKVDPFYSQDNCNHVIYLKSYSKIIFPGLRVGVAVIPPSIANDFHKYKKILDIDSPMISQAALEIYIKSGMFERHKSKIKYSYYNRSIKLAEILEKMQNENPSLFTYNKQNTLGIHTCLEMQKNIVTEILIKKLSENQISIDSIDRNYLNDFHKERLLKLNVSNVKEDKIEEGIRKVIEEVTQLGRLDFQFKKE
ncbi:MULTISPECIES: aminotransferase-like domain-containing protein [Bacillus cereus group]|uniref:GntR family transcriptional regulator n=1 Tax=Bacillus cereus TaxID=1396 RepID=A0A2A8TXM8_BACCE|nr:PLP-dependent aminotransferase family protein [Bacillus cereus]PDY84268.1 GntR family transcriptional regulator [Bacillus cereus]PFA05152.1 GntR family transcriptional regulator [Bacillus cereus]PFM38348.1 GntR family transcriptional regulator [Bacillus cereus]PGL56324.1 GntR family transcriptional regulator [Bacillus cereus]PGQ05403.1 GntR family transcriptional regulator [Bacillus cereus]